LRRTDICRSQNNSAGFSVDRRNSATAATAATIFRNYVFEMCDRFNFSGYGSF
jgi:hypothetical protein